MRAMRPYRYSLGAPETDVNNSHLGIQVDSRSAPVYTKRFAPRKRKAAQPSLSRRGRCLAHQGRSQGADEPPSRKGTKMMIRKGLPTLAILAVFMLFAAQGGSGNRCKTAGSPRRGQMKLLNPSLRLLP